MTSSTKLMHSDNVHTADDCVQTTSTQSKASCSEAHDWHSCTGIVKNTSGVNGSGTSDVIARHTNDHKTVLKQGQLDSQSQHEAQLAQQDRQSQQQQQQQQQQQATADKQSLAEQLQQAREELIALQYSLACGTLAAAEPASVSVRKHNDDTSHKHWSQQQVQQQQQQHKQQQRSQLQQQQQQQQNRWEQQQQQRQQQELLRQQRSQELHWRRDRSQSPTSYAHRSCSDGSDDNVSKFSW
jgi:hypothetical protein